MTTSMTMIISSEGVGGLGKADEAGFWFVPVLDF